MADDKLAAALDEIRERGYENGAHGTARLARLSDAAAIDVPRLLAALDALLKSHEPRILYRDAENCGHECPVATSSRGEYYHGNPEWDEWDEWDDSHPHGSADGGTGERICLFTEIGTACPACSTLVYDVWDGNGFVDASDCLVLPAITRALLGAGDQQ